MAIQVQVDITVTVTGHRLKVYQAWRPTGRQGGLNDFSEDRNPDRLCAANEPTAIVVVDPTLKLIAQLEQAYRDTNHIDHAWWDNPNVITNHNNDNPTRSTSVGDIIVSPGGIRWIVDSCGFILYKRARVELEEKRLLEGC